MTVHRTASIPDALSRLAELQAADGRVLSLYLNFDPGDFPTLGARRTQADAVIADLERKLPSDADASHADRMKLREEVEQVRALLTDDELTVQRARGLAVFCSVGADAIEVVTLPRGVEPMATVEGGPFIEPLIEIEAPERWCVLLISRRTARVFRGTRERLVEIVDIREDVHGQHAQGGWSQARYQRGIEHEVDEHIRGTCSDLFERFNRRRFDRLLIGSPSELRKRVEDELHADLGQRLVGHFEIDVERATPAEAHERALPLIEADERRREAEALERLAEGLAPDGHGAAGIEAVLDLLADRRVGTLLIQHGFSAPGYRCPRCGRLSAAGEESDEKPRCPLDGAELQPCGDIVESAIELAREQAADVLVVRERQEELAKHGAMAALLRY